MTLTLEELLRIPAQKMDRNRLSSFRIWLTSEYLKNQMKCTSLKNRITRTCVRAGVWGGIAQRTLVVVLVCSVFNPGRLVTFGGYSRPRQWQIPLKRAH